MRWLAKSDILLCNRDTCAFEQRISDIPISSNDEEVNRKIFDDKDSTSSDDEHSKRGFISALLLPESQDLLCITADGQFFLYYPVKSNGGTSLSLKKRLVRHPTRILDMKFLGDDDHYLSAATSVMQVLLDAFWELLSNVMNSAL